MSKCCGNLVYSNLMFWKMTILLAWFVSFLDTYLPIYTTVSNACTSELFSRKNKFGPPLIRVFDYWFWVLKSKVISTYGVEMKVAINTILDWRRTVTINFRDFWLLRMVGIAKFTPNTDCCSIIWRLLLDSKSPTLLVTHRSLSKDFGPWTLDPLWGKFWIWSTYLEHVQEWRRSKRNNQGRKMLSMMR